MTGLLKKELRLLSTEDLNTRYCHILKRGETLEAKDIPATDAKEILWIEDQLRERLIKYVGHDFYPPDRIEKRHPSNYMISLLNQVKPKPKLELALGTKIKFNVVVTSSFGSRAANFSVPADTKLEAGKLARKEIRKLGLQGATYKIL